jgi:hypothetical protein
MSQRGDFDFFVEMPAYCRNGNMFFRHKVQSIVVSVRFAPGQCAGTGVPVLWFALRRGSACLSR